MDEQERLQILEMIEKGVISAEEGVRLLNSLQGEPEESAMTMLGEAPAHPQEPPASSPIPEFIEPEPAPAESRSSSPGERFESGIARWRRWWWIPLTVGIGTIVVSALLMFVAYSRSGFGFWFACLWFPLLFGIIVTSLAAASRTARWLHVRVQQAPGEHPQSINISLPIPIRFTALIMRIIKPRLSGLDNINLDEALLALEKVSPQEPFYVKVDEDESGEKVEVYIG
jgi:hypothetical protein